MTAQATLTNWSCEQGTHVTFDVVLQDENHDPLDISADVEEVWFTAKLSHDDTDIATTTIQKTLNTGGIVTIAEPGVCRVKITPEDTEGLTARVTIFEYDVKVKRAGENGDIGIPIKGQWRVYRSVTRARSPFPGVSQ